MHREGVIVRHWLERGQGGLGRVWGEEDGGGKAEGSGEKRAKIITWVFGGCGFVGWCARRK